MKRIFIIVTLLLNIVVLITYVKNNTYASEMFNDISKPLIVRLGDNYQNYLEYDNYDIISSNVNFNKCGIYEVIYENIDSGEQVRKSVYVKNDKELLDEKNYCESYSDLLISDDNIKITKVKKYEDDYFIAYRDIIDEELSDIKLMKINDGQIIFDTTVFNKANGQIVDFIVNDKEIAILVEKANTYSYLDIYYIVISHQGKINYSYKYSGRGVDTAKKILESDKYYYLIVETSSGDEGSYIFQHTLQSGVVFVVEKGTNERCELYGIVEDSSVNVIDAINIEDDIYVIYNIYNSQIGLQENKIAHISQEEIKDESKSFSLTVTEDFKKITSDNNNIYILTNDYNSKLSDYVSKLYKMDKSLNKELILEYQYSNQGSCNIADITISSEGNIILIYNIVDLENSNPYGYLYQILDEGKIVSEVEQFTAPFMVSYFVNSSEFLFVEDNQAIINTINYVTFTDLLTNQIKNYNADISIPKLYINGEKIPIDYSKSIFDDNINQYGNHNIQYYFTSDKLDVVTKGEVQTLPYSNIYENGIFDLNTRIYTNSNATLNDIPIDDGYKITNIGTYELVLNGNDEEQFKINFEVKSVSNNETILNDDNINYEVSKSLDDKTDILSLNSHITEDSLQLEEHNTIWMVLIPFFALIGLGAVILNKR